MLKSLLPTLLVLLALALPPGTVLAATGDDVVRGLVCMCGCTSVLSNCPHRECMVGEEMKGLIRAQLSEGKSLPEITQYFVQRYGEQVLASPTKKGFNITAWAMPFLAILAGALAIYYFLKLWVLGREQTPAAIEPQAEGEYRLRLEDELKKFDEGRP